MTRWLDIALGAGPYREWLTVSGSLTRALRARAPGFHVTKIRQEHDRPFPDEYAPLALAPSQRATIREVVLHGAAQPLIFAHTVIPEEGMRGPWRSLHGLGNRPLGEALFADPRIKRFPLRYRRLNRHHPLHRAARARLGGLPDQLWARRSLFALEGMPIMVTEIFLPGVLSL